MVSILRLRLILVGLVVFRCAGPDQRGTSPTYSPSSPSKPCSPARDELAGGDFAEYSQASGQMSQSASQKGAARDATCSATKCFARGTFCACAPGATPPASDWTEVSSCPMASASIKCCAFGEYDPAPAGWGCFCSTSSCAEFGEPALHVSCNVVTDFSAPQCTMPASSFGAGAPAPTGSSGATGSTSATGSSGATGSTYILAVPRQDCRVIV